jgi:hypothetical protein
MSPTIERKPRLLPGSARGASGFKAFGSSGSGLPDEEKAATLPDAFDRFRRCDDPHRAPLVRQLAL